MNPFAEVFVLCEGATEKLFIRELLAPYLRPYAIYPTAILLSKPGAKGGDVKF